MTKNDGFRSPDDLPHCVTELIPEFSSSDCCRAWATTAGRMVPRGSLPRRIHLRGADRVRCIVCYLISLIAARRRPLEQTVARKRGRHCHEGSSIPVGCDIEAGGTVKSLCFPSSLAAASIEASVEHHVKLGRLSEFARTLHGAVRRSKSQGPRWFSLQ